MTAVAQPRLFALCEVTEALEHHIVAWGMEFLDAAVLFWRDDGKPQFGMFDSAERAEWFMSRVSPLHIEWIAESG